jgi:DNA-binding response OmpR family regulator
VLVIEDDASSAELARVLLEAEGFDVVIAVSAEEALVLAQQRPPMLIALDLCLPGIDGWEFLLSIRDDSRLAQVPVVIISAVADNSMALARGASAVLQKPIGRAALRESLSRLGLEPRPEQTHTVLVVDDDPNAVEILAAFMPSPDYAVVRAFGGGEAIALAGRVRPDLILLDLNMPGVTGFDVVTALQRNVGTATIPILVITAREVTAADRDTLTQNHNPVVQVIDKADFNRGRFITEVKRALQTVSPS